MRQKTTVVKGNIPNRKWFLVDLNGQTLGRICAKIAQMIIGKDNPLYSFNRDDGDYVVAINAQAVTVTGTKNKSKIYYRYTNYPGHLKEMSFQALMKKDPRQVIIHGVYGMLPKNKLRDRRIRRLKVFVGTNHPYSNKIKP